MKQKQPSYRDRGVRYRESGEREREREVTGEN